MLIYNYLIHCKGFIQREGKGYFPTPNRKHPGIISINFFFFFFIFLFFQEARMFHLLELCFNATMMTASSSYICHTI